MTKFTAQENATRKQVFDYNRKKEINGWMDSCTKMFGKSKVVRQAVIDSNKRIASHTPVLTGHDAYKANLQERLTGLASCLPDSGYSMGESKHITCRHLGTVSEYDARQWYKGNKYSPTHGRVSVELPIRLLAKAEKMHGLITIRTKQIQNRIWKCQWVEFDYTRNGRGIINSEIGYRMVSGYVVRREERFDWTRQSADWYHTRALDTARNVLARSIEHERALVAVKKEVAKRDAIRAKEAAKRAKVEARERAKAEKELAKRIKAVRKSKELKDILAHMYVYQDSIKAGNCVPGTNNFLATHNLQKTDTRSGEFLLRISAKTFQHENVIRVLIRYATDTYPDFCKENNRALRSILRTL